MYIYIEFDDCPAVSYLNFPIFDGDFLIISGARIGPSLQALIRTVKVWNFRRPGCRSWKFDNACFFCLKWRIFSATGTYRTLDETSLLGCQLTIRFTWGAVSLLHPDDSSIDLTRVRHSVELGLTKQDSTRHNLKLSWVTWHNRRYQLWIFRTILPSYLWHSMAFYSSTSTFRDDV